MMCVSIPVRYGETSGDANSRFCWSQMSSGRKPGFCSGAGVIVGDRTGVITVLVATRVHLLSVRLVVHLDRVVGEA